MRTFRTLFLLILLLNFQPAFTQTEKTDEKAQPVVPDSTIVTALNLIREKESIGYTVQGVENEDIPKDGSAHLSSSLSGKVAGLQVIRSSGNLSGSSLLRIRGISSITGNNQPLFVVDGTVIDNSCFNTINTARGAGGYDFGNMASDIIPGDVESVTVLKGSNASALYGSRGSNGAILITTKKGSRPQGKQIGIEFNTGISFEQVSVLPEYQDRYGGGDGGVNPAADWEMKTYTDDRGYYKIPGTDAHGNPYQSFDLGLDYNTPESFGPSYDETAGDFLRKYGIDVPSGSIYDNQPIYYRPWNSFDSWDTENFGISVPWESPEKDVKDFFCTGIGWTNNIAFSGGTESSLFRLGIGTYNSSGYMPNSSYDRYNASLNASIYLIKNIQVFTSLNYIASFVKGRAETGYGTNNPMVQFSQFGQRQLDFETLESFQNQDGFQRSWNRISMDNQKPAYSDNPYWDMKMNYENDRRDRYYGNAGISWQITDWLRGQGKANLDNYVFRTQERIAVSSVAQSMYRESIHTNSELNLEFLLQADKTFGKNWRVNATAGGNLMTRNYTMNTSSTVGGLLVPEKYSISNASSSISGDYRRDNRINSIFFGGTGSWKNMIFMDLSLRNDWTSLYSSSISSNLYPGVSLSFVVNELPLVRKAKWLTLAKIRGGWAMTGNDTDPYTNPLLNGNISDQRGYPYNLIPVPQPVISVDLENPDLKPEVTSSWELGTELHFLKNRVGVDFTWYNKTSTDQILPKTISSSSGYSYQFVNAGKITNKGVELVFSVIPVRIRKSFEWSVVANFGKNTSRVVELAPGISDVSMGTGPFQVSVDAVAGYEYGQLMGTNFVFDQDGNKVVDANGRYLSSGVMPLGSILPEWNMGIGNQFRIYNFDVSVLFDIQHGGNFFSTTKMWGTYSGMLEQTAEGDMRENGIIIDATVAKYQDGQMVYNADGTAQVTGPNTTVIAAETWCKDHYYGPAAQNVLDASYIKLREITLSYTFPGKLTGPVKNLKIGLFGRNLATFGTAMKGIDPEQATSNGNIQGIEGGGLPMTRTFGFNIGFNF